MMPEAAKNTQTIPFLNTKLTRSDIFFFFLFLKNGPNPASFLFIFVLFTRQI